MQEQLDKIDAKSNLFTKNNHAAPHELDFEIEKDFDIEAKHLRSALFETLKTKSMIKDENLITGSYISDKYRGVTKNGKIW